MKIEVLTLTLVFVFIYFCIMDHIVVRDGLMLLDNITGKDISKSGLQRSLESNLFWISFHLVFQSIITHFLILQIFINIIFYSLGFSISILSPIVRISNQNSSYSINYLKLLKSFQSYKVLFFSQFWLIVLILLTIPLIIIYLTLLVPIIFVTLVSWWWLRILLASLRLLGNFLLLELS